MTPLQPDAQRPSAESRLPDQDRLELQDPWAGATRSMAMPEEPPPRSPTARDSGKKYVDYKLDPAPSWDGSQPEKQFKEFHRNLLLWLVEAEARLPHNLIGKRIIDSIPIGSKLGAMLAHLTVDEITAENGHKQILRLIEEAHEYLKDQRLEQAFDEAIFRGRRERGMTLTAFLTGKKAAFAELRKQGLDLLASSPGRHLLGHLILRQGAFSQDQRQRLKVVTNGSIDFREIESAIQKVFGDKLDESAHYDQHAGTPRRWRSNTFYGDDADENYEDDLMDDDGSGIYASEWPEDEGLEDLICLNDNYEAQLIFAQDLPGVMEESEALEALGWQLEEVFYETQHRFGGKGKGKGKKGKGKSHRTFAGGSPHHGGKGGGYLEHRRRLQAARNGRGFDKPWQRQGSRLSINELKAKSRCHQCKQLGHWSKECPHRGKMPSSPSRSASSVASTTGAMTTGFFTQPPKAAGFGQFMTTTVDPPMLEQYMSTSLSGLSFVFLGMHTSDGTALVDTAAQHGLVGMNTLTNHDHFVEDQVRVAGSVVRGVRRFRARNMWPRREDTDSLCPHWPRREIRSPQGANRAG